jgi:hypothetical protein
MHTSSQAKYHGKEHRRQEDAKQGHADHAAEHGRPEGLAHLGAGLWYNLQ